MDRDKLKEELYSTLKMIDEQISVVENEANSIGERFGLKDDLAVTGKQLKHPSGGFIMIDLLLARSDVLASLTKLKLQEPIERRPEPVVKPETDRHYRRPNGAKLCDTTEEKKEAVQLDTANLPICIDCRNVIDGWRP